jgi:hypothetical protein
MRAIPDNDAWAVERQIGASVAVDPEKHRSFGINRSNLDDFGPSKTAWTKTTGDLGFSPSLFQEVVHGIKNVNKSSTHSDKKP